MVLIFWTTICNSDSRRPHWKSKRFWLWERWAKNATAPEFHFISSIFITGHFARFFWEKANRSSSRYGFWSMIFPKRFLRVPLGASFFSLIAKKGWHPGGFFYIPGCVLVAMIRPEVRLKPKHVFFLKSELVGTFFPFFLGFFLFSWDVDMLPNFQMLNRHVI